MTATVKLQGFAELAAKLKELPQNISKNALRAGVSAGAVVIKNEAKRSVPVDTGTLKRAIYHKQAREQSNQYKQVFIVGVKSGKRYQKVGKKQRNFDAFYWRFIEFGTRFISARPFLRPAFEKKKFEAIEAIKNKLKQRIDLANK